MMKNITIKISLAAMLIAAVVCFPHTDNVDAIVPEVDSPVATEQLDEESALPGPVAEAAKKIEALCPAMGSRFLPGFKHSFAHSPIFFKLVVKSATEQAREMKAATTPYEGQTRQPCALLRKLSPNQFKSECPDYYDSAAKKQSCPSCPDPYASCQPCKDGYGDKCLYASVDCSVMVKLEASVSSRKLREWLDPQSNHRDASAVKVGMEAFRQQCASLVKFACKASCNKAYKASVRKCKEPMWVRYAGHGWNAQHIHTSAPSCKRNSDCAVSDSRSDKSDWPFKYCIRAAYAVGSDYYSRCVDKQGLEESHFGHADPATLPPYDEHATVAAIHAGKQSDIRYSHWLHSYRSNQVAYSKTGAGECGEPRLQETKKWCESSC